MYKAKLYKKYLLLDNNHFIVIMYVLTKTFIVKIVFIPNLKLRPKSKEMWYDCQSNETAQFTKVQMMLKYR